MEIKGGGFRWWENKFEGFINLGPDRLAGTKSLDTNNCRQPTNDLCLKVQTVHSTELRLFRAKAFPLFILLKSRILHSILTTLCMRRVLVEKN